MIDRYVLLAEDNPNDAELTIAALRERNMVCPIHRVADGEEALDFLHRRGAYAGRSDGPPALILLPSLPATLFCGLAGILTLRIPGSAPKTSRPTPQNDISSLFRQAAERGPPGDRRAVP